MRQMASLLYQLKGPLNENTKSQVDADSDNMLRPLMDFLDTKWVKWDSFQTRLICLESVAVCERAVFAG